MSEIERLTVTLPSEMAADIKGAVEGGHYASASDVVREAVRDWKAKRTQQLKADIDKGLADVANDRVKALDVDRIIERGKVLLASRSRST